MSFPYRIHSYLRMMRGRTRAEVAEGTVADGRAKEYPRMPRVSLEKKESPMTLSEALRLRSSDKTSGSGTLTITDVGAILGNALAERPDARRPHPSGGASYPIETYLLARSVGGLERAVYHYLPRHHALERLWDIPADLRLFENIAAEPAATIVLTGIWQRTYRKYGDFGYLLATLEAGHIGQNILLAATAFGARSCPLEGFSDAEVIRVLDLREFEQPLYTITLGAGR